MKKNKYYNKDERDYIDGYGIDSRKSKVVDKRKEKRFERALKVKNIDDIKHLEDDDDSDDYYQYTEVN